MYSENLSDFLDFLRNSKELYNIAVSSENDTENATQDILHKLELEQITYHENAKLAKLLAEVRQSRRQHKNTILILQPLIEWINAHPNEIKTLERTLGDMKKNEKKLEQAFYIPRTDILQEVEKHEK